MRCGSIEWENECDGVVRENHFGKQNVLTEANMEVKFKLQRNSFCVAANRSISKSLYCSQKYLYTSDQVIRNTINEWRFVHGYKELSIKSYNSVLWLVGPFLWFCNSSWRLECLVKSSVSC